MDPNSRTTWTVGHASWPVLQVANRSIEVMNRLRFRSVCEAEIRFGPVAVTEIVPAVAVLKNILLRGWPCPVSQFVDDELSRCLQLTDIDPEKPDESGHRFGRLLGDPAALISRCLAHLDSRKDASAAEAQIGLPAYDSAAEEWVGEEVLGRLWGGWPRAAFSRQGRISAIIEGFDGQRADFTLALPAIGSAELPRLWSIEVDGDQHQSSQQRALDLRRDAAHAQSGGGCVRVILRECRGSQPTQEEFHASADRAGFSRVLENDPFLASLALSWRKPMWSNAADMAWLELVGTPLAIARVQRAIIHALECGILSLDERRWVIAVNERDVTCSRLAVDDFMGKLAVCSALSGGAITMPEVQLYIRCTPEFSRSPLRLAGEGEEWANPEPVQLLIDVSVLQKFGQTTPLPDELARLGNPPTVLIRNADLPRTDLRGMEPLAITDTVEWVAYGSDEARLACETLLRDIFRKRAFRDGQWPIISRALERDNTVGVLPTGSGKSICYQLVALLQPCQTIVVPPLVALAADQVRGLTEAGIHRCCTLSGMTGRQRETLTEEALVQRRHLFIFAMPERFQSEDFRLRLSELAHQRPCPVRTLVIDEVHCVSEWGHDFRPAYLWLGRSARNQLGPDRLRVIGLTGTASFDVLTDAAREVGGLKEKDLIEADQFDRPNLRLKIYSGSAHRIVGRTKQDKVPTLRLLLLENIPKFFGMTPKEFYAAKDGRYARAGVIFCPHSSLEAKASVPLAVGTVAAEVRRILTSAGIDAPVEAYSSKHAEEAKRVIQGRFIRDEVAVLVSTIAFGMGIDKSNIRFVVHYSGAKSVEAYYQEIGRAGRDGGKAFCATILNDDGGDRADALEAWLQSRDPHLPSPRASFAEQDDRHVWKFFHESNFPPVKQTRRLIWELAKLLEKGEIDQRVTVPFDFAHHFHPEEAEPAKKTDQGEKEVEREICRLSCIGLVRDYLVDKRSRQYLVQRGDFSDAAVTQCLAEYVQRYKSPAEAKRYSDALVEAHAQRKALHHQLGLWAFAVGVIVDFAYREISVKRRGALREYMRIMRLGLRDEGAMRQEINYYFNSKYYRELQAHANGCGIEVLWSYIAKMDGGLDELRQLYGGVVRHLANNPDNTVFRLLRAYCLLAHANFDSEEALSFLDAFKEAEDDDVLGRPGRATVGAWIGQFEVALRRHHPEPSEVVTRWVAHYEADWVDRFLEKHSLS
jgi:ATP-dependent DNA helicase RecQ